MFSLDIPVLRRYFAPVSLTSWKTSQLSELFGAMRTLEICGLMKLRSFHFLTCLMLLACGVRNDPQEIADAFCYRYLIELNQTSALEIASGLAADKLRKEIESLKGSARTFDEGESEFHRLKPFIDFKLQDRSTANAENVTFAYRITIESRQGNDKMEREIFVNTTRVEGRWLVSNYTFEH